MTDSNKKQPNKNTPPTPAKGQRYPSLGKQVKNLGQSARDVIRNPALASNELFLDRMLICKACDYYDDKQNRCRKCGCMLKGKARFQASKCPLQKW